MRWIHFLQTLKTTFCHCVIESILTHCQTSWYANCIETDQKNPQRVLTSIFKTCCPCTANITFVYVTQPCAVWFWQRTVPSITKLNAFFFFFTAGCAVPIRNECHARSHPFRINSCNEILPFSIIPSALWTFTNPTWTPTRKSPGSEWEGDNGCAAKGLLPRS